jgi:hypothetical protein
LISRDDAPKLQKTKVLKAFLILTSGWALTSQAQVAAGPFGMHMHAGVLLRQPWPTVIFATMRLRDAEVSWAEIHPSSATCKWAILAARLNEAQVHNRT